MNLSNFKRAAMVLGLLMATTLAHAQAPAPAATVQRPATLLEPNAIRDAGISVAQMVDAGKVGELWDGASPTAKQSVPRATFVSNLAPARKTTGRVTGRQWITVRQVKSNGGQLPAGVYASVDFETSFEKSRSVVETVSFRLDNDGVWRFVGYTLR